MELGNDGDPYFAVRVGNGGAHNMLAITAIPISMQNAGRQTTEPGSRAGDSSGTGIGEDGEASYTITSTVPAVAQADQQLYSIMPMNSGTDYKARAVDVAQPLMTAPTGGNQGGDYVVEPTAIHLTQDPINGDVAPAQGANSYIGVQEGTIVRRLTELECERLQGYPDGWTDGQAGSARYRQLGNSVAVPCVEWIARRLVKVDEASA